MRVGYIRCSEDDIIFLTGDLEKLNDAKFKDLYHYAIDIISRNWNGFYVVRDKLEEVRRQRTRRPPHLYSQPEDMITFDETYTRLR